MAEVLYHRGMNARRLASNRMEGGSYEIVVVAAPFGPPLTPAEQVLRGVLGSLFVSLVAFASWLLWNTWSLRG